MAVLGGGHMVHRRILAGGVDAVVATLASYGHALMIKHPGGKTAGVMTHAAILGGGNVRCCLACG